jgi:hypothetical protein
MWRPLLLALALAAAPLAACAAPLDAAGIEKYRFAVDLGCREAAGRGGNGAREADAYCRCVAGGLRRSVPERRWREAAELGREGSLARSLAVLAPHMAALDHCRSARPSPAPARSLVGAWEWRVEEDRCTEVYTFRPDGTAQVVSGEEKTDNTYTLGKSAEPSGRFRFSMTTTRDNRGRDCTGSGEDGTGKTTEHYLHFNPAGDAFLLCAEPTGTRCFGPLLRRK